MGRKDLLRILQERVADAGRDRALPHRGTRRRPAPRRVRPRGRRRRPQLRRPHAVRRRVRADAWTAGTTSTSGSAPTWCSRRSSSSSSRRSGAPCRSTATPTPTPAPRSSSRCTRTSGAAPGLDRTEDDVFPPGVSDEYAVERISGDLRRGARRATGSSPTTPSGSTSTRSATSAGTTATWCSSATPPTPRTSPSAPGTKLAMEDALALAACLHEQPTVEAALEAYQDGAQAGRRVDPARRPGVARVVREHRHVRRPGPRAVRLQPDHPVAPHHLREPQGARPRLRGPDGGRVRPPARAADRGRRRRCSSRSRSAALRLKNRVILSPMDMYVAEDGVPGRLPPRAPGLQGPRRRRAGDDRDDLRVAGGPDHARLPGPVERRAARRAGSGSSTSCTRRPPRAIGMQLGHSGRKGSTQLMWEGMDEPLPDGNWEVVGPSPLPYGPGCHVPREMTRADLDAVVEQFVGVRAAGGRGRLRPGRGARRPRLPAVLVPRRRSPTGAPTSTAARWRTGCASRSRSSTRSAPRSPPTIPVTVRISATDWMPDGNTEEDAVEIARAFIAHGAAAIDVSSGQVSQDEKPAFGRSYQTPFADRIRHEVATSGRRPGDRRRRHLVVRRRQLDPAGRPRRPVRPRPHAPLRPACGPCTRRPSRSTQGPAAEWPLPWQAGRRRPPTVAHRQDPAAPLACCATRPTDPVHVRWRPGQPGQPDQ